MTAVTASAAEIDDIVDDLELTLQQIERCAGGLARLRKAEFALLTSMKKATQAMTRSLRAITGTDRSAIISVFGGDCLRIARIRQVIDDARFTSSSGTAAKESCLAACLSVEGVLNDTGYDMANSLARANKAVANKAVAELQAQVAEELVQANAVLTELGIEPLHPMSIALHEGRKQRACHRRLDVDEAGSGDAADVAFDLKLVHALHEPEQVTSECAPEDTDEVVSENYVVSNDELKAKSRGLAYRSTPDFDETSKTGVIAKWGTTVAGIDDGFGWLRVGESFLPMMVRGCVVIRSEQETCGPPSPLKDIAGTLRRQASEESVLPSLEASSAEQRKRALQAIVSGELQEISDTVFKSIKFQTAGKITWNSRGIPFFIKGVFKALSLTPPSERQMYVTYRHFDLDGTWSLDSEHCNSLIELFVCESLDYEAIGHRRHLIELFEAGQVATKTEEAFLRHASSLDGLLRWNGGIVRNFILEVFSELKIKVPAEAQMYAMAKRFDTKREVRLDFYEARRLVETLCRSLYQAKVSESVVSCQNEHAMKLQLPNKLTIRCDVCDSLSTGSTIVWSCRRCDFDMCLSCCKAGSVRRRQWGLGAVSFLAPEITGDFSANDYRSPSSPTSLASSASLASRTSPWACEAACTTGTVLAMPTFRALRLPPRQAASFLIRDDAGKIMMQAEVSMRLWELPIIVLRSALREDSEYGALIARVKCAMESPERFPHEFRLRDGPRSADVIDANDKLLAQIVRDGSSYTLTSRSRGAKLIFSGNFAAYQVDIKDEQGAALARTALRAQQKSNPNIEENYNISIMANIDLGMVICGLLFIEHVEASVRPVNPSEMQRLRTTQLDSIVKAARRSSLQSKSPFANGLGCLASVAQVCSSQVERIRST